MTALLRNELAIDDADGFYDRLMELHRDLDAAQSQLANAKLVLLLANHIGDRRVLDEAIQVVARGIAGNDGRRAHTTNEGSQS